MSQFDLTKLTQTAKASGIRKRAALVASHDSHALEAVISARREGLIEATLIGDSLLTADYLAQAGEQVDDYRLIDCPDNATSALKAIELVKAGELDFIIKGLIETAELMKPLVNKETGLVKVGAIVCPVALIQSPRYHKVFALADVGINLHPDQDKMIKIIDNAVWLLKRIGVELPKVALLSAAEKVNPKLPDSLQAEAIKQLNDADEITGCIIEGPISLDLAIDKQAAAIKNYQSPVAGDADALIVPDIVSGNLLIKGMGFFGDIITADVVLGLEVPLVFGSRGGPAEGKLRSIALAALVSGALD
jgi:phosphate butyryltransferase